MACSKVTKQIKTKFKKKKGFSWVTEGTKLVQMVVLTFTKLAIMSIYGKLLKNHILSNQYADDIKTCYRAV